MLNGIFPPGTSVPSIASWLHHGPDFSQPTIQLKLTFKKPATQNQRLDTFLFNEPSRMFFDFLRIPNELFEMRVFWRNLHRRTFSSVFLSTAADSFEKNHSLLQFPKFERITLNMLTNLILWNVPRNRIRVKWLPASRSWVRTIVIVVFT